MTKKASRKEPYAYTAPSEGVTLAIKAIATGTANEGQQMLALRWIIEDLCGTYDLSYRPQSDRDTVFAEGKRYVGLQLVREINIILNRRTDNVST